MWKLNGKNSITIQISSYNKSNLTNSSKLNIKYYLFGHHTNLY